MANAGPRTQQAAHLLAVVVPGLLDTVTQDIVQHKSSFQDIKGARPPISMLSQVVVRHLHTISAAYRQLMATMRSPKGMPLLQVQLTACLHAYTQPCM